MALLRAAGPARPGRHERVAASPIDFSGRDAVGRFFQGVGENWEGLQVDLEGLVSEGEQVLTVSHIHGRLRATGEETGYRSVHAWTVRDGVPVRFAEYVDAPVTLPAAHAVA